MKINPDLPKPRRWEPMRPMGMVSQNKTRWENRYYTVTANRKPGARDQCVCIMIVNADQSAMRDWREFQRIKNEICGKDWVAYEIYPAESKAVDPSNAFFLWCFPSAKLPHYCGMDGPRHFTPEQAAAPQRGGER